MTDQDTLIWDLWIPDAASQGVSFARGWMQQRERVWVHAAPANLRVEVIDAGGSRVAFGDQLKRSADTPMSLLTVTGDTVARDDRWPTADDLGTLVILPGGEVGTIVEWWNDQAQQEWRWRVEFYNHR
ncbi:MAG: hypothetical protein NVSMB29_11000 [Candidatus Dormibacteria bacterium]